MVKTYDIGTRVWWFSPMLNESPEVKEGMVLGSFVHRGEGELFYHLTGTHDAQPAYAVCDSEDGIKERVADFEKYRKFLLEANEANHKRFDELREGFLFPEYKQEQEEK